MQEIKNIIYSPDFMGKDNSSSTTQQKEAILYINIFYIYMPQPKNENLNGANSDDCLNAS